MKDTKFIELLNLYIDQQIDPADAARLEEEIARNPARRVTYQQYCRMHRACTMMFEQSRPTSDVGVNVATAAAIADEKIRTFSAPRRSYAWVGYGVGLAAAACVAVIFAYRPALPPAGSGQEVVQVAPKPAAPAPLAPASPANYQAVAAFSQTPRRPAASVEQQPSLDWMRQVQFTPIVNVSAQELVFEQAAPNQADQRAFHSRLPVQNTSALPLNAEKAAWQFER
ncbi:MAG TPA: hypothetical protein VG838_13695 [Opitutaceae bacterium]|nr:hypothetical protein [Opitutaceae bacterium]